jgi:hypothetical protein
MEGFQMIRARCIFPGLILGSVILLLLPATASALPIFARRYETSCTTCHIVIPKLNVFGMAFRNNGYRIPLNDERFIKTPDVPLGAPAWKTLWPKAVWPGAIPGMPPIAIRVASDVNIRPASPVRVNFDFPNGLSLYFAGPAGDSFSFFGNVFLSGATNALFLDRAYGQFRLVPESPGQNWLVLKVGRIDTRAEPFSSTFRRTTSEGFNTSDFRPVSDGFRLRDHDAGIELWGAATGPDNKGGLEYGVGVVQGTNGRVENNNFKDYYWSVSYKAGGHGVVGSRQESTETFSPEEYKETSISVGSFMYMGKGQTRAVPDVAENQFTRTGVKIDAWVKNLNMFAAFVRGNDELRGTTQTIETSAIMAQAEYPLLPWVMPVARFEKTNYSDGRRNVVQFIPAVNLLVRANVRVLAEGHFFNREGGPGTSRTGLNEGLIRLEFLF